MKKRIFTRKIGDVLICKKEHEQYGNINIVGEKYLILNVESNGNVYVSTDLTSPSSISNVSTPYSLSRNSPFSSLYIDDYFISLEEYRDIQLKELGI